MPILIKSSNGERKVEILSRNVEKKGKQDGGPNQEQDLRSTLISLLRGMSITLELKVNDVLVASSNSLVNIQEPANKNLNVEEQSKPETLNQLESEEIQEPFQQVPAKIVGVNPPESAPKPDTAPVKAKTSVGFAPLQALKIRPKLTEMEVRQRFEELETRQKFEELKIKPSVEETEIRPKLDETEIRPKFNEMEIKPKPEEMETKPKLEKTEVRPSPSVLEAEKEECGSDKNLQQQPILQSSSIRSSNVADEPLPQTRVSPKPVNKPPEVVEPNKPFLIFGDLKVGSAVTTVGLSVASEDPIVVYVTYDQKKLVESVIKIQEISDVIEAQSMIKSVDVGDIIFGKSNEDDNWYRGVVMSTDAQQADIYFFDWGITETLDITRIRRLTELGLGLAKFPACAVKVKFTDESKPYLNEVLGCEKRFSMKVESFDQDRQIYTGTVTKIIPDD